MADYTKEIAQIITQLKASDKSLTTPSAKKDLDTLGESIKSFVNKNIGQTMTSVVGAMIPNKKEEIREIIDLLSKKDKTENDELMAVEKIKKLTEQFNVDIKSFLKIFGVKIEDLNKVVDKMKQIEQQRQETIAKEQSLLQKEGISYKTGEDGKIQVLNQKERLQEINDIQMKVDQLEKEKLQLQKDFEKKKIDSDKYIKSLEDLNNRADELEARKIGVGYDDTNRPQTFRDRFTGMAQGVGGFLRGERGPEILRPVFGAAYGAVRAPIDAGKQLLSSLDALTFGLGGAVTKSLFNFLSPSFKSLQKSTVEGFKGLGGIFSDKFKGLLGFLGKFFFLFLTRTGVTKLLTGLGIGLSSLMSMVGLGGAAKSIGLGGGLSGASSGAATTTTSNLAKAGRVLPFVGRLGALGLAATTATAGYYAGEFAENAETTKDKALGVAGTTASGAATGALIGSVVPVVGTAFGALVGGLIGGAYGLYKAYDPKDETSKVGKDINKLAQDKSKADIDAMKSRFSGSDMRGYGSQSSEKIKNANNAEYSDLYALGLTPGQLQQNNTLSSINNSGNNNISTNSIFIPAAIHNREPSYFNSYGNSRRFSL